MSYTFRFNDIWRYQDDLIDGLVWTLTMTVIVVLAGFAIGIACAIGRNGGTRPVRIAIGVYVEAIRNTPLLIQLFLIFFGLPVFGIRPSADEAAIVGLSINLGAYATEIVRAGIESIPRGQREAAAALGLSRLMVFRHVIIPPALRAIWPALSAQSVLTLLATSVASQISATELLQAASFIDSRTYRTFEVYLVASGIYLGFAILLRLGFAVAGHLMFARWAFAGQGTARVQVAQT